MPRVKRGVPAHAKHKKVLAITKGSRASRSTLYRRAHETMLKALSYQYRHRKEFKRDMRSLWIVRVNAGAREAGLTYSQLMHGLKIAGVDVNRKMLAEMAVNNKAAFAALAETAKAQFAKA